MHLVVNLGGIPHLAKNERDVGHPSLVREPEADRCGIDFKGGVLTQTLPGWAHVLAVGPPGLAFMATFAVSFLSQLALGKSVPSTASRGVRRDDKG
jgi:hypothetical protein